MSKHLPRSDQRYSLYLFNNVEKTKPTLLKNMRKFGAAIFFRNSVKAC